MAELEDAAKRLDQSEGGKSALADQVYVKIVFLQVEKIINVGSHYLELTTAIVKHSHRGIFTDIFLN